VAQAALERGYDVELYHCPLNPEKVEQVRQNISMVAGGALPRDLMEAISNVVPDFSDRVIVPAMWHR